MDNNLSLEQKQVLSQSQIQAIEVLTMDSVSLNDYLYREYLENPMMEHNSSAGDSLESISDRMKAYQFASDSSISYQGSVAAEDERTLEIPDLREGGIRELISGQLSLKNIDSADFELSLDLVEALDEHGYFPLSAEEAADLFHASPEDIERCLSRLRMLEPAGIFAEDLEECLIRQMDANGDLDEVAAAIIRTHLQDIGSGHLKSITRDLHISTANARMYIEKIRQLNPRPLTGIRTADTQYVIPDIILERNDDRWSIVLNDKWVEDYRISDYYLRMMQEAEDEELKEYFRGKLEHARFVLRTVDQRRKTLTAIAEAILERQKDYFEGYSPLVPMTMQDIAEDIGIHTSTVSRGVKDKYLQFPEKTVLMKKLFSQSVASAYDEEAMTAERISGLISGIIASEDPENPYSDQKIAAMLKQQGIVISRRTVAKYREAMLIPGIFQRKKN